MSGRSAGARRGNTKPPRARSVRPSPPNQDSNTIFGLNPKSIVAKNRERAYSASGRTDSPVDLVSYGLQHSAELAKEGRMQRIAAIRAFAAADLDLGRNTGGRQSNESLISLPPTRITIAPPSPPVVLRAPTLVTFASRQSATSSSSSVYSHDSANSSARKSTTSSNSTGSSGSSFVFPGPSRSIGRPDRSIQPEFRKHRTQLRQAGQLYAHSTGGRARSSRKFGRFRKRGSRSSPKSQESVKRGALGAAAEEQEEREIPQNAAEYRRRLLEQPPEDELYVVKDTWNRAQGTTLHPYSPVEAPYPQSYDGSILQNDLYSDILLSRLRPAGSPLFYDYGDRPPWTVLDLGCGPGLWAMHAANTWQPHGTKVIGFDLVDLTRNVWPTNDRSQNLKHVRGNFVRFKLPFEDGVFEVVRMSNLALCIPREKWVPILREVQRILRIGGRLELIDDAAVFPYAQHMYDSQVESGPTQGSPIMESTSANMRYHRDSSSLSSTVGSDGTSSHIAHSVDGHAVTDVRSSYATSSTLARTHTASSDFSELPYTLSTPSTSPPDSQFSVHSPFTSDSRTISPELYATSPPPPSLSSSYTHASCGATASPGIHNPYDQDSWEEQACSCEEFEILFESMLDQKFGIDLHPSEYLLDVISSVFGAKNTKLAHAFDIDLASPEFDTSGLSPDHSGFTDIPYPYASLLDNSATAYSSKSKRYAQHFEGPAEPESAFLAQSPGLKVISGDSMRFLPLPPAELEKHAYRNPQLLLGCKSALSDFVEITMDSGWQRSFDEGFWDSFALYQSFMHKRLDAPVSPNDNDAATINGLVFSKRDSISSASISSAISLDVHSYQNMFREEYSFDDDEYDSDEQPDLNDLQKVLTHIDCPIQEEENDEPCPETPRLKDERTISPEVTSPTSLSPQDGSIHIRTIRVFEAVKR